MLDLHDAGKALAERQVMSNDVCETGTHQQTEIAAERAEQRVTGPALAFDNMKANAGGITAVEEKDTMKKDITIESLDTENKVKDDKEMKRQKAKLERAERALARDTKREEAKNKGAKTIL